jgi:MoaA/NifB/PqqE/SkfB family radical SAM enzyme
MTYALCSLLFSRHAMPKKPRSLFRLVLEEGGPGFCQFAVTNACNARCDFCGFALDKLKAKDWKFVPVEAAVEAIDILYRHGIRYLVVTGGEPLLHCNLEQIVRSASGMKMIVLLVTNGALLVEKTIRRLAEAGVTHFIISIDAATPEQHEANRGLLGVCQRIREANRIISKLGLRSTASTTMSRLVDYEMLPGFLESLNFSSVTFSYPITLLKSSYLGYAQSRLIDYDKEELLEAFEKVKRLKRRFHVVNPISSLDEMRRFLLHEEQRYPCLAGYKYFYLDWNLNLWRCHYWREAMCSIFEFDGSQIVRDGCTRCMIDCYRDASVLHHAGISLNDALRSLRSGRFRQAAKALLRKGNFGSIQALLEELRWIIHI